MAHLWPSPIILANQMDHQIAPLSGLGKSIGLSPPFSADLSLTWEDFLQLSVKSIWVGQIEFLLFWHSSSKQSCWVGREVQENNHFKSWFEHFSKEPQWGYDEALWSFPCRYKLWGAEKKKKKRLSKSKFYSFLALVKSVEVLITRRRLSTDSVLTSPQSPFHRKGRSL